MPWQVVPNAHGAYAVTSCKLPYAPPCSSSKPSQVALHKGLLQVHVRARLDMFSQHNGLGLTQANQVQGSF